MPDFPNPYTADAIKVMVDGPDEVKPGEVFVYVVKVRDIDMATPYNPTGIDPSLRIHFKINSMSGFEFQIAPNPDSDKNMVCVIRGRAHDSEGVFVDYFRGYNQLQGLTWDRPTDQMHVLTIKA